MSRTHVVAVIDESTSMCSLTQATIDGFNEYTDELKKDKSEIELTNVTLVKFSSVVNPVYVDKPLAEVERLNHDTYEPNGATALYDAIGRSVSTVQKKVAPEDKVIVVVITDGYENASREFSHVQILSLITQMENQGNWTFVYLGANQDAMAVGTSFGVKAGNTMSYDASYAGTQALYTGIAGSTSALRSAKSVTKTDTFFEDPKKQGSTKGTTSSNKS